MKHAILQELKECALELRELGVEISRQTYRNWQKRKFNDHDLVEHFGGFSAALLACGIVKQAKKKKIDLNDKLFKRDLEKILAQHDQDKKDPPKILSKSYRDLLLGDIHFPFSDDDAISFVYAFAEKFNPNRIVQFGDLYDMFAHTKFARSHNIYTPKQEYDLGRKKAEQFWATLRKICPKAECYQILGNHDVRPLKRLMEVYPEGEMWFDIKPAFTFDGVITNHDYRQELHFEDYSIHHGYLSKLGDHRDFNLRSMACAHSHRGGVVYRSFRDQNFRLRTFWELNPGYLGDPTSKALGYTPQKYTGWTKGLGAKDEWGPRFIPIPG